MASTVWKLSPDGAACNYMLRKDGTPAWYIDAGGNAVTTGVTQAGSNICLSNATGQYCVYSSNGRLGLGLSNPGVDLDIVGTARADVVVTTTASVDEIVSTFPIHDMAVGCDSNTTILSMACGSHPQMLNMGTGGGTGVSVINMGMSAGRGASVINIGSGTGTGANMINVGAGTGASVINVGTGPGASVINLGGPRDTVNVAGTLTYVSTTDLKVTDRLITINKNGSVDSAVGTGLEIEEAGAITGYIKTSGDRKSFLLRTPAAVTDTVMDLTSGAVNINDATLVLSNGRVAIQNSNPTYDLDVTGTARATGGLVFNNASSGLAALLSGTGTQRSLVTVDAANATTYAGASNGANVYLNPQLNADTYVNYSNTNPVRAYTGLTEVVTVTGCNVGIGNTTPTYKVDITGTTRTTGISYIGNGPTTGLAGPPTTTGLVLTATASNSMAGTHIAAYTGSNTNPVYQQLHYNVDNLSHTYDAYYDGSVTRYSSAATTPVQVQKLAGKWQVRNAPTGTAGSAVTFNTAGITLDATNRVGVKQPSPVYDLDVTGTARATTALLTDNNSSGLATLLSSGTQKSLVTVSSTNVTTYAGASNGAAVYLNPQLNSDTFVNYSNVNPVRAYTGLTEVVTVTGCNVGIGNTAPTYKLDVTGTVRATGGSKITVQGTVDGGSNRGLMLWQDTNTDWGLYLATPGAGKSLAGGTSVAGHNFSQHAVRMRAANGAIYGFVWENSADALLMSLRASDGNAYHAGSVGVKQLSPAYDLDVTGTTRATSALLTNNNSAGLATLLSSGTQKSLVTVSSTNVTTYAGASNGAAVYLNPALNADTYVNYSNVNPVRVYTGLTEALTVTGCNVGITQTNPVYDLDVLGTTRATSALLTNNNSAGLATLLSSGTQKSLVTVSSTNVTTYAGASNGAAVYLNPSLNADTYVNYSNVNPVRAYTGLTEVVTVTGCNVGIANTAPTYRLDVTGTSMRLGQTLVTTSGTNVAIVNQALAASVSTSVALWQGSGGDTVINSAIGQPLYFKVGNTEYARIQSDGVTRVTGGSKLTIQNSQDGGSNRGIMMWNDTDTAWGIYMGSSGATKSLSGGTAVAGRNFSQHAVRVRVPNASTQGVVFENSSEALLMSVRGSDGSSYIAGNATVNNALIGDVGHGASYAGLIHNDQSANGTTNYAVLSSSSGDTYVNAKSGQTIYFRNNNQDVGTWTSSALNVSTSLAVGGISFSQPVGMVVLWSTGTAPTGWLICDGAAVSRTTYAALFAVISTTYGAGNGSTTFNLPNMTGRVVAGVTGSGGYTLGGTGGANSVTLSTANMPSHTHTGTTGSAGSHNHGGSTVAGGTHSHTASTDNQGNHQHGSTSDAGGEHNHGGGTQWAGDHTHTVDKATPGGTNGGFIAGWQEGDGLWHGGSTSGSATTSSAGNHWHGMNGSGTHTHWVWTDWQGGHTHTVTVNDGGSHSHTINSDGSHNHGFTTDPNGSGTAFSVTNSYIAMNYIIKFT